MIAMGTRTPVWTIADRMGKARREAGLSTAEMADLLGVSRQTVGNWEAGRVKPSKATLLAWSTYTDVALGWILTGSDNPQDPGTVTHWYHSPEGTSAALISMWGEDDALLGAA